MTQEELASKSGVSLSTIKKVESGAGCSLANFINLLRGLSLTHEIETLLPEPRLRPTERLAIEKKMVKKLKLNRKRASSKGRIDPPPSKFTEA